MKKHSRRLFVTMVCFFILGQFFMPMGAAIPTASGMMMNQTPTPRLQPFSLPSGLNDLKTFETNGAPQNSNIIQAIPALQYPFCGTWQIQCAYGCNLHTGQYNSFAIDWANRTPGGATWDAPIYAAHDGTVVYAQTDSVGSNTLLLRSDDGNYVSMYGHLNSFSRGVGNHVVAGEEIGKAGASGATSAHLHFAFGQYYYTGNVWAWTGIAPEPMSGQTGFVNWQYNTRDCSTPAQPIVMVDEPNLTPGYNQPSCPAAPAGSWTGWVSYDNALGHNGYLTLSAINQADSTNSGKWTPDLPLDGRWKIEAHNPVHPFVNWPCLNTTLTNDTANASYLIVYNKGTVGGATVVSFNQQTSGQWLDLGTYDMGAGKNSSVELTDLTGEATGSKYVSFSAMRFTCVSDCSAPVNTPTASPTMTKTPTPLPTATKTPTATKSPTALPTKTRTPFPQPTTSSTLKNQVYLPLTIH